MDTNTYAESVTRRWPDLYRYASAVANQDTHLVDDLVNQSQVEIVRKLDHVKDENHWWLWSKKVINLRLIDEYNNRGRLRRKLEEFFVMLGGDLSAKPPDENESIIDWASIEPLFTEDERKLHQLLLAGASTSEIAKVLGITEGAARIRKTRLVHKIRMLTIPEIRIENPSEAEVVQTSELSLHGSIGSQPLQGTELSGLAERHMSLWVVLSTGDEESSSGGERLWTVHSPAIDLREGHFTTVIPLQSLHASLSHKMTNGFDRHSYRIHTMVSSSDVSENLNATSEWLDARPQDVSECCSVSFIYSNIQPKE